MSSVERDPKKRRVKPIEQPCVIDFDEESSDDSDFRIEDHPDVSDDDIDSLDSGGGDNDNDSSNNSEAESDDSELDKLDELRNLNPISTNGLSSVGSVLEQAKRQSKLNYNEKDADLLICCGCLGDHSDGINEIVECDSCGVTVHEACYGISDSSSLASTNSLSPTAPWFCEACKAGVKEPVCELCPNSGGIFKETDVGKWVHLICALYVPGVAFGEVDKLTSVTLFEMQYSKWGAKTCSLCPDGRFARTGVCIGCDAGMCRTYFHVTCAQREGFLSEAHCEEADQADPFYAHCKLHSDKTLVKRRKRNYLALQLRNEYRRIKFQKEGHMETPEQVRIQRKLAKQRVHYLEYKKKKNAPWVPTQKMPRLITTSASACRKLLRKAEQMGIDTSELEMHDAQIATLADIRKKWHIPPAFTVEFIAYYLDRNERLRGMKATLEQFMEENKVLLDEQQKLRTQYDEVLKRSNEVTSKNADLKASIQKYHSAILSACPTKNLPNIDDIGKPPAPKPIQQTMAVPTAAALKMGVGFPLKNIPLREREDRVLSSQAKPTEPLQLNECGICRQRRDQHLLAKCDTCHLYYHTDCLNPPLARLPKKSKLYGWQCSECDKSSDSEVEHVKAPRRSRSIYSRDRSENEIGNVPAITPKLIIKPVDDPEVATICKAAETSQKEGKKERRHSHNDKSKTGNGHQAKKARKHSSASDTNMVNEHADQSTADLLADLGSNEDIEVIMENNVPVDGHEGHKSKKRRRDKHRNRYSPELGMSSKEHKRKRKKKSVEIEENSSNIPHPRITIKIKSIPLPAGEVASESNPQCFYVPNEADDNAPALSVVLKSDKQLESRRVSSDGTISKKNRVVRTSVSETSAPKDPLALDDPLEIPVMPSRSGRGSAFTRSSAPKPSAVPVESLYCDVCQQEGSNTTAVRCDECLKLYHFSCLDPPLKSSPKKRGYSWHCADCDPTGSE
ncbi:PHD finger protein 14 isoform X2 [Anthonomus grandis grandis]|uniref:PHD finger protein 14 isoform X2 n=1 Tax=Anthonomus grandis grandis TaxID=2921223 RepID=UPI002165B08D|nr:PHD finger protein 14 isoform X2 [Anthonomus grandis grandis]